jgi:hypothetical protein
VLSGRGLGEAIGREPYPGEDERLPSRVECLYPLGVRPASSRKTLAKYFSSV